jgi:hypothetical protein
MSEVRHLKVIKKDLSEVDKLIIENKELLATFPDDISLKIGLRDLLYRQKQIFSEIKEAKKMKMQETFDMVLEEGDTPDSEISFSFLGDFLSATQDLVTAIINREQKGEISKGPISNDIKSLAQLNVVATSVGSFRIIITGNPGITEPTAVPALSRFNSLLECGDQRERIKEIRAVVGARVMKKYKDFIHIMKIHKANVTFYDEFGGSFFSTHKLTNELANNIYSILETVEEMPEIIEEYTGKLRGTDVCDKSFHFETVDGIHFRGKFIDEIDSRMKKPDLDKEVTIKVKHNITYVPNEDREVDKWDLIEIKQI